MKLQISFLLLFSTQIFALSRECNELFSNYVHPSKCCKNYPFGDTSKTTADHCYRDCLNIDDDCCLPNCIYDELRNFNNGKFSLEQRRIQYESSLKDKKSFKEKWQPVIESSTNKCEELSELWNFLFHLI